MDTNLLNNLKMLVCTLSTIYTPGSSRINIVNFIIHEVSNFSLFSGDFQKYCDEEKQN